MIASIAWKRVLRRRSVWFSLAVIASLGLVALLAPWLAPHDPYRWGLTAAQRSLPPFWVDFPGKTGTLVYPLGTDFYGRDVLSRLLYGTRTALVLAMLAVPTAAITGTLLGLLAGYRGGRLDAAITWLTDTISALPAIMFLVLIVLILRAALAPTWINGILTLVIGYAAVGWVSLARLVRVSVLQIRRQVFVEAAVGLGASAREVIGRHLLPNVLHVVLVWIINNIPVVILLEALLGYIGVGVTGAVEGGEFTVVSWGGMFFSGRAAMSRNPLMLIIPSVSLLLLSMSFVLLGDALNEASRPALE